MACRIRINYLYNEEVTARGGPPCDRVPAAMARRTRTRRWLVQRNRHNGQPERGRAPAGPRRRLAVHPRTPAAQNPREVRLRFAVEGTIVMRGRGARRTTDVVGEPPAQRQVARSTRGATRARAAARARREGDTGGRPGGRGRGTEVVSFSCSWMRRCGISRPAPTRDGKAATTCVGDRSRVKRATSPIAREARDPRVRPKTQRDRSARPRGKDARHITRARAGNACGTRWGVQGEAR